MSQLPPLLYLPDEAAYRQYFIKNYCHKSRFTFDNLEVRFFPDMFDHAFYKRSSKTWTGKKDTLDLKRCERMPWIAFTLNDNSITPLQGYDHARRCYDGRRRVALLTPQNYVVVIRKAKGSWKFVTAYLIDNKYALQKILSSPKWVP